MVLLARILPGSGEMGDGGDGVESPSSDDMPKVRAEAVESLAISRAFQRLGFATSTGSGEMSLARYAASRLLNNFPWFGTFR